MPETKILNIHQLAGELSTSSHTLKKRWRELPHFFVGGGKNLKGARFDFDEVITYLKQEASYDNLEGPEKRRLDRKIQTSTQAIQKRGFSKPKGSYALGGRKTGRVTGTSQTGKDPFNLLAGIERLS